jgi:hypothetical protein
MTAVNNAADQKFVNNADGFLVGGGTTERDLTVTGGNITITGANANTYTFPTSTSTLASLGLAETFSGAKTFSAIITNTSGRVRNVRVVTAAGAVTVATTDDIIVVNKTSGAATVVNLPPTPTTGQFYIIKDGKGDASTNNITITPAAGNIDGSATYVMNTNYQSAEVVYNGSTWSVV